jgi:hypothetical protein
MTIFTIPVRTAPTGLSWDAAELSNRATWHRVLPLRVGEEFTTYVASHPGVTTESFQWDPAALPRMESSGRTLRSQLMSGDGVAWVHGLDELGLSPEHQRCLYLALGCAMGEPMLQYGRMYPVVDRGADYTKQNVPVSMTNAETSFHTDSSSVDVVPDVIGLLCEQPASHGGDSLVSNALRVYQTLMQEQPDVLEVLERPWIRDVVTPGLDKNQETLLRNRFPVFAQCDGPGGILFRYMRYWIGTGHDKAGLPLDSYEQHAFDVLDELLNHPEHVVKFRLEKGDMLWVNNRVMAHNRTAFHDEQGNRRCMQRMWLQVPQSA